MRTCPLAFFLTVCLLSCSVDQMPDHSPTTRVVNTCKIDSDCRASGRQGMCGSGMCVASSGRLTQGILEIVPPASAFFGAGDSFLIPIDDISHGRWNEDLALPRYANVEGILTTTPSVLGDPPSESCSQAFDTTTQSLRVHVDFSRSDASQGLPGYTVAANAERVEGGTGFRFAASVPSGKYDVYATVIGDCEADFPPLFAPKKTLDPGNVMMELHVGALSTLTGTVTPPVSSTGEQISLTGWTVSLVEPEQGKVISTMRKLNDSNPTNFEIRYQPLGETPPILQIVPPKDLIAPTITWDLSVLDLDGDGQVQPSISALDLATVQVNASVVTHEVEPVAGATVRLRSTALMGASAGLNARYETSATTDAEGMFSLSLLPGTYQVVVTPPDRTGLSISQASWTIGRSPAVQSGRAIEVATMYAVEGTIVDPIANRPIENISVIARPSTMSTGSYAERIFGTAPLIARAASTLTGAGGGFVLGVDPGVVDITAQPSDISRFPWLVVGRAKVPSEPLGTLTISFPIPWAGTLRDPNGNPVQQARLRVYALLGREADGPADHPVLPGVLPIAETRTDKHGAFTLLLPSEVEGI